MMKTQCRYSFSQTAQSFGKVIQWAIQSRVRVRVLYSKWREENRKNRSISGFPGRGQQCNIIWDVQPPGGHYISLYSSSDRSAFFFFLQYRASLPRHLSVPLSLHPSLPLSFFSLPTLNCPAVLC